MNIALIAARGGSKGLPGKNIISLCGKPLIGWTIEAATKANSIERVYVSTEDEGIAKISTALGAEVIKRPANLAQDDTASDPVILHAINVLRENKVDFQSVAFLQPTSPIRGARHIDEAYELFVSSDASCVLSVFEPEFCAAKAYKLNDDGTIEGLFFKSAPYYRRQDLPRTYLPNGAIYLFRVDDFLAGEGIPRSNVYPYIMTKEQSIDIDTVDDLKVAEQYLKRGGNE